MAIQNLLLQLYNFIKTARKLKYFSELEGEMSPPERG